MVLGERCSWIQRRTPAPIDAARAPLVAIAATAPIHTSKGAPKRAAMVAAVICPTSPHSEKKMAAKETITARDAGYSFLASRLSGLRHRANAMAKKLTAVMAATSSGGSVDMAFPTSTATAILAIKATTIPHSIGTVRYRVAR